MVCIPAIWPRFSKAFNLAADRDRMFGKGEPFWPSSPDTRAGNISRIAFQTARRPARQGLVSPSLALF
jgi:hypothetical protein